MVQSAAHGGRQLALDRDIVIVGGGAAGRVVARRLADAREDSVLLLEAGPELGAPVPPSLHDGWNNPSGPDWGHDWGFESEPDGVIDASVIPEAPSGFPHVITLMVVEHLSVKLATLL